MLTPQPYVPGQTPRPAEGTYDALRATVRADCPPDALHDTAAFQAGLTYLQNGWYWEAHEVLEPVWMQAPPNSVERQMAQALIQLANARLKLAMHRPHAAARLVQRASDHLSEASLAGRAVVLGLPLDDVQGWIDAARGDSARASVGR